MKTVDEILATWDEDGYFVDWYAIDSYNPNDGVSRRMFVGTPEDAAMLMRESYAVPSEFAKSNYYRCSAISSEAARAYFEGTVYELESERGAYSITEAAGILNVSRQRVHKMLETGKLEGRKVGNTWTVYRYSVEARLGK